MLAVLLGLTPPWAAAAPDTAAPGDFMLLVESMSTDWETQLIPPLLTNLRRIAPYATARMEAPEALRIVATTPRRLAVMRRSSVFAVGAEAGLEILELGPAACLTLVVREDAPWGNYADLNYGADRPLRIEAVSPGALRDLNDLLGIFPLAAEHTLLIRPTHVAIQRLKSGDIDAVALDVPRRGASDQPAEVMAFARAQRLRPLELPRTLATQDLGGRQPGEIVLGKGWFWEHPVVLNTMCDPFVLAMPAHGADQTIYALYSALALGDRDQERDASPGFLSSIAAAFNRLLVALGLLSPPSAAAP